MKSHQDAAIAAIATAPVNGAVGILRVSGAGAVEIAEKVFSANNGRPLSKQPPRTLVFGLARDRTGAVLDKCLAVRFPAPYSYTGEDVAELHCHGGAALLSMVLQALIDAGARMAEPGEYTRRAFLNGKLDLTQAEAVADLIDADWQGAVKNAAGQLAGVFGERLRALYARLTATCAGLAARLDWADQNVEAPPEDRAELAALAEELAALADTAAVGRAVKEGVRAAVIGRPNAGKSSLFNRLLGYDRSIVTAEAGTTRDVVSEKIPVGGVPLLLSDTAGIRAAEGAPETAGVALARREAERADLLLCVFDASAPLTAEDAEIMAVRGRCELCVANKADLGQNEDALRRLRARYETVLPFSAKTGEGTDALAGAVKRAAGMENLRCDGSIVTNARQADGLRRAAGYAREAAEAAEAGAEDALWGLVSDACREIGKLLGAETDGDVEREIFSRFCLGK